MSRKRGRNVPVMTDRLVDRLSMAAVALVEGAIAHVDREQAENREAWFGRPGEVSELLADRLAVAEYCVRFSVRWYGYQSMLGEAGLDFRF